MAYVVSYSTSLPSAFALNADNAKQALEIARDIAAKGHEPMIDHDGQKFSLRELETVVSGVKFGGF